MWNSIRRCLGGSENGPALQNDCPDYAETLRSSCLSLALISASSWTVGNRFSKESTLAPTASRGAARTFSRFHTSFITMLRIRDSRVGMSSLSTQPGIFPVTPDNVCGINLDFIFKATPKQPNLDGPAASGFGEIRIAANPEPGAVNPLGHGKRRGWDLNPQPAFARQAHQPWLSRLTLIHTCALPG